MVDYIAFLALGSAASFMAGLVVGGAVSPFRCADCPAADDVKAGVRTVNEARRSAPWKRVASIVPKSVVFEGDGDDASDPRVYFDELSSVDNETWRRVAGAFDPVDPMTWPPADPGRAGVAEGKRGALIAGKAKAAKISAANFNNIFFGPAEGAVKKNLNPPPTSLRPPPPRSHGPIRLGWEEHMSPPRLGRTDCSCCGRQITGPYLRLVSVFRGVPIERNCHYGCTDSEAWGTLSSGGTIVRDLT